MIEMGVQKGEGLYFEIAFNEKKILEDGIYDLDKIYNCLDEVFARNDCILASIDGPMRTYTRNKDDMDLQCLFFAVSAFRKTDWFEEYVSHFMFYPFDEMEEDWLVGGGIHLRRNFRLRAKEIISSMKNDYVDSVKEMLEDTPYLCTETDDFILFHRNSFDDYTTGLRLISVGLEECKMPGIASLICLMQDDELPASVMVAFMKNTNDKRQGIQNLVKLLKKTKRTFRAIVLDVTNTGWEEACDFTVENCYLTQRMYKNLVSALHGGRGRWKIIPEDRKMLKGILFDNDYFTENAPRGKECDYFQEFGVKCFSFCLPVKHAIVNKNAVEIDMHRLGWYMYKLIDLAFKKI